MPGLTPTLSPEPRPPVSAARRRPRRPTVEILGVSFFQGTPAEAAAHALTGGLTVAPSAPGLADDLYNPVYAAALHDAELVMPDSGYMVLLWWLLQGERIQRISGLALMAALLRDHPRAMEEACWVMPSTSDIAALERYLEEQGITCGSDQLYQAPHYGVTDCTDQRLLERLEASRPPIVIIGIAGGKQEALGAWLRDHLSYRPAIICIGAAIAFLTGAQTRIPWWADRLFLGWACRFVDDPRRYARRYLRSFKLSGKLLHQAAR